MKYNYGVQINNDVMGKACGTCEGEEKCIDNIRKDLKEIA
jgi:hypothetical protein